MWELHAREWLQISRKGSYLSLSLSPLPLYPRHLVSQGKTMFPRTTSPLYVSKTVNRIIYIPFVEETNFFFISRVSFFSLQYFARTIAIIRSDYFFW